MKRNSRLMKDFKKYFINDIQVSHSMPIVDVQHDKTKEDKFFSSAELL